MQSKKGVGMTQVGWGGWGGGAVAAAAAARCTADWDTFKQMS